MNTYLATLSLLLVGIAAVGGLYAASAVFGLHRGPLRVEPYSSGGAAEEHAFSRFHARWYALTLLFLAFDVEMLFMYPWALVVAEMGTAAVVEMFGFLGLLMVGVLYAWREGALRWA